MSFFQALAERFTKIILKKGEFSSARTVAADQDKVSRRKTVLTRYKTQRLTEAAFCAVTNDRVSNLFRDGKADTAIRLAIILQHLHNHSRGSDFTPLPGNTQKLRPLFQAASCVVPAQAESFERPLVRRFASTRRPPTVALRARKP